MICADASIVVKWVLDEERSDQARALLREAVTAGRGIIAPPLLPIELTNILRQRTRPTDGMSLDVATRQLDRFLTLPITIHNPDGLHQRALALSHVLNLPAAYDAHYLALAEYFGCELWTDDRRLLRAVQNEFPFVRQLGEYPISEAM